MMNISTYILTLPVGIICSLVSLVFMEIFCGEVFIQYHSGKVFFSALFFIPAIIIFI